MSFEIVTMASMLVVGPQITTSFATQAQDIPAFWGRFYQENTLNNIPHQAMPGVALGVYTDYSPDFSPAGGTYGLITGCPVSAAADLPAGMIVKQIPAAKYAVFTAKGPFHPAIFNTWMEVWSTPELERTFVTDFEWYDQNSTNDEQSIVKIYIGIK